jgi:hypothetical protein
MLAYYNLYGKDIVAFPKGFRMLAGNTNQRALSTSVQDKPTSQWTAEDKTQKALAEKAMSFNCLHYLRGYNEASMERHFFPDKDFIDQNCDDGIRAEMVMPSCWNGQDLDSRDHKSHVAYPDLRRDGVCPPGFEKRLPSMFFETIWNTAVFKGVKGQFIWSNGDTTGK